MLLFCPCNGLSVRYLCFAHSLIHVRYIKHVSYHMYMNIPFSRTGCRSVFAMTSFTALIVPLMLSGAHLNFNTSQRVAGRSMLKIEKRSTVTWDLRYIIPMPVSLWNKVLRLFVFSPDCIGTKTQLHVHHVSYRGYELSFSTNNTVFLRW